MRLTKTTVLVSLVFSLAVGCNPRHASVLPRTLQQATPDRDRDNSGTTRDHGKQQVPKPLCYQGVAGPAESRAERGGDSATPLRNSLQQRMFRQQAPLEQWVAMPG